MTDVQAILDGIEQAAEERDADLCPVDSCEDDCGGWRGEDHSCRTCRDAEERLHVASHRAWLGWQRSICSQENA